MVFGLLFYHLYNTPLQRPFSKKAWLLVGKQALGAVTGISFQ